MGNPARPAWQSVSQLPCTGSEWPQETQKDAKGGASFLRFLSFLRLKSSGDHVPAISLDWELSLVR
jgi:hypothetical protein